MRTTRSRKVTTQPTGKENGNPAIPSSTMKAKEKAPAKKPARNVKANKSEELFCSCRGVDDGTPMVECGICNEWSALLRPFLPSPPPPPRVPLILIHPGITSGVSSSAKTMQMK